MLKTTAILQCGMDAAVTNNNAVLLKAKLQHIKSTRMSILYALSFIEENRKYHHKTLFQETGLSK